MKLQAGEIEKHICYANLEAKLVYNDICTAATVCNNSGVRTEKGVVFFANEIRRSIYSVCVYVR